MICTKVNCAENNSFYCCLNQPPPVPIQICRRSYAHVTSIFSLAIGARRRHGREAQQHGLASLRCLFATSICTPTSMAAPFRRPLPMPPDVVTGREPYRNYHDPYTGIPRSSADVYSPSFPYFPNFPYPQYSTRAPVAGEQAATSLPGGTLLHKGFYDLLALIPATTATASRLLWGAPRDGPVAGPRYEHLAAQPTSPAANTMNPTPASPRKGRRISKDMVSRPMNFV